MTTMTTTATTATTATTTTAKAIARERLQTYIRREIRWAKEQNGLHPDDIDYDPDYVHTPWTDSDDDSDKDDKKKKEKMTKIDYRKFQKR